ncbi:MAG: SpaA isopeptide-forming pilin-related protein, partial [Clostridium sp.]|uniref:SpaA isopeptide-forming pilin-related protein n=1 Tax=Clostridium sp. TaxID=1506 RepID=UPI003F2C9107
MKGIFKQKNKKCLAIFILILMIVDILPTVLVSAKQKEEVNLGTIQHYNGIFFGNQKNGLKDYNECTLGNFDKSHTHDEHCTKGAETEGAAAIKGDIITNKHMQLGFAEHPGGPVVGEYDPDTGNPLLLLGGEYIPNGSEKIKPYSNYIVHKKGATSAELLKNLQLEDVGAGETVQTKSVESEKINAKFNEFLMETNKLMAIGESLDKAEKINIQQKDENKIFDLTIKDVNSNNVIDQGANGRNWSIKKSKLNEKVLISEGLNGSDILFKDIYLPTEVNDAELIVMYSDAKTVKFNSSGWLIDNKIIEISGATPNGDLVKKLAPKIVWVLPNAENVYIAGCGVVGSVIAPKANIKGKGGSINGQVIANDILQLNGFELHNFHFIWDKVLVTLKGKVQFTKVGEENKPLEGVRFGLYKEDGTKIKECVTDNTGKVMVDDLDPGNYYFQEIEGKPGYTVSNKKHEFTIKVGQTEVLDLGNIKNILNEVKLTKVDANNVNLEGAEFTLYEKLPSGDKGKEIKKVTTGKDGVVSFKGLSQGEYIILETKAPEGYKLSTEKIFVTVNHKGEVTIEGNKTEVVNEKLLGNLEFKKLLEGTDAPLENMKFGLYLNKDVGNTPIIVTSDSNGNVSFKDIPEGTHLIRELEVPDIYDTPNDIIFSVDKNGNVKIESGLKNGTFYNKKKEIKGSISFKKVGDNALNVGLQGAEFGIFYSGNNTEIPDVKVISGADGSFGFTDMPKGIHVIKELSVPNEYEDIKAKIIVEVLDDGKVKIISGAIVEDNENKVVNYKKPFSNGNIKFKKVDSDNKVLSGAKFGVFYQGNNTSTPNQISVSSEIGEVKFNKMPLGTHKIKEIEAPKGYELNKNVLVFTVSKPISPSTEGEIVDIKYGEEGKEQPINDFPNFSIKNEKILREYSFTKVGEVSGESPKPLEGIKFSLTLETGEKIELISDKSGVVSTGKILPVGTHKIKEIETVDGYVISSFEIEVVVDDNGNVTSNLSKNELENKLVRLKNSIKFKKVDENNNILTTAEFKVTDKDGKVVIDKLTSDKNGVIEIKDLLPGVYKIKETRAPIGYELNEAERIFIVKADGTVDKEELDKITADFKNVKNSVKFTKKDEENKNVLSGAIFELYKAGESTPIKSYTTGSDGTVIFDGLAPGEYEIKEVKAPEGYELSNEVIKVTVDENGKVTTTHGVDIYNKAIYGSIEFTKVDLNGHELDGAEFTLRKNGTNEVKKASGVLLKFEKLKPGNYTIEETKVPVGYEKMKNITFTINAKGETVDVVGLTKRESRFLAKNRDLVYRVSFKKVDDKDKNLKGAEFGLYKDKELIQKSISDANGNVNFEGVLPGDYIIKETRAPEGYELSKKEFKLTVGKDGSIFFDNATELTVKNELKLLNSPISFRKVNEDGVGIGIAKFRLSKEEEGKYNEFKILQSSLNGDVTVENIPFGKYMIEEVEAPTGYELSSEKRYFEVNKDGSVSDEHLKIVGANFENKKTPIVPEPTPIGKVSFIKVDKEDGKVLEGAEFKLYKEGVSEAIKTIKSDKDGKVEFADLEEGKYSIEEKVAPNGYEVSKTKVTFEINKKGETVNLEGLVKGKFENKKTPVIPEPAPLGKVSFIKVDKEDGKVLEGAEFKLYKEGVSEAIKTVKSDKEGKVEFT